MPFRKPKDKSKIRNASVGRAPLTPGHGVLEFVGYKKVVPGTNPGQGKQEGVVLKFKVVSWTAGNYLDGTPGPEKLPGSKFDYPVMCHKDAVEAGFASAAYTATVMKSRDFLQATEDCGVGYELDEDEVIDLLNADEKLLEDFVKCRYRVVSIDSGRKTAGTKTVASVWICNPQFQGIASGGSGAEDEDDYLAEAGE